MGVAVDKRVAVGLAPRSGVELGDVVGVGDDVGNVTAVVATAAIAVVGVALGEPEVPIADGANPALAAVMPKVSNGTNRPISRPPNLLLFMVPRAESVDGSTPLEVGSGRPW
jgi:hypothetical protein